MIILIFSIQPATSCQNAHRQNGFPLFARRSTTTHRVEGTHWLSGMYWMARSRIRLMTRGLISIQVALRHYRRSSKLYESCAH